MKTLVAACLLLCSSVVLGADAYQIGFSDTQPPNIVHVEAVTNVVKVQTTVGMGSGTYLGDRLVLTAEHVVDEGDLQSVSFPDPSNNQGQFIDVVRGRVLATDSTWDQAVIELDRLPVHNPPGSRLANDNPKRGEPVTFAGYPGAGPLRMIRGSVYTYYSAQGHANEAADWFEGGGNAIPGYSGGASFNDKGELYGNLWGSTGATTTAVCLGRTKRFLLPWNARLEAWRLTLIAGKASGGYYWCPPNGNCRIVGPGDPGYYQPSPGPGQVPLETPAGGIAPSPPPLSPPVAPATPDVNIANIEAAIAKINDSISTMEKRIDKMHSDKPTDSGSYTLSEEDTSKIVGQLLVSMEGNPAFKGEKGDKGDPGKDGANGQSAGKAAFTQEDYTRIAMEVRKKLVGEMRVSVQPVKRKPAKK